jgi:HEPN domain
MPSNQLREVQRFYRVAAQRFEEAEYLFKGERYAAAIYLGGYAVECSLKALILSLVPRTRQTEVAEAFRGGGWHRFERLKDDYMARGGASFPIAIARSFSYVSRWTVESRYVPGERPLREAKLFLDSTKSILEWINGRL